jgi:hypothetical protein
MRQQTGSENENSTDVRGSSTNIEIFRVLDDGSEQLVAHAVDPKEVDQFQDWWRYSKPFGSELKIVVRANAQKIAGFSTTGTEPGSAAEDHYPEVFIG